MDCNSLSSVSAENPDAMIGPNVFKNVGNNVEGGAKLYVPKSRVTAASWSNWTNITALGTGDDAGKLIKTERNESDNSLRSKTFTLVKEVPQTCYFHYPVDLPDGVEAYTGKVNDAKTILILKKIETTYTPSGKSNAVTYIPAGTPVLLYGTGTATLTESSKDDYEAAKGNDLMGSITATEFGEVGKSLVLGRDKDNTAQYGFYKNEATAVPANQAYLLLSQALEGDETNGVDIKSKDYTDVKSVMIDNNSTSVWTDKVYKTDGSLEPNPQTGTVYIVNGRKVIYLK